MKGAEREGKAASRVRDKKARTPRNESSPIPVGGPPFAIRSASANPEGWHEKGVENVDCYGILHATHCTRSKNVGLSFSSTTQHSRSDFIFWRDLYGAIRLCRSA